MKEYKLLRGYNFKSIRYKDYFIFLKRYPDNELFVSLTHVSSTEHVSDHLRFVMDRPFEYYSKRIHRLVMNLSEHYPPNICISRVLYYLIT